jgi:N utilization substance protein B
MTGAGVRPKTAAKPHEPAGERRRGGAGKRRTAREMALQMLYQRDVGASDLAQIFHAFDLGEHLATGGDPARQRRRLEEAFGFARRLVRGAAEHQDEIDELIARQADNWRLERMPIVDRNVLRLAVYEMLYSDETPELVVVDEAIELAKKYGSEQSGRFINGLLDGLLKAGVGRRRAVEAEK